MILLGTGVRFDFRKRADKVKHVLDRLVSGRALHEGHLSRIESH